MSRLYYIITLLNRDWAFAKAKSLFVFWQWIFFIYFPFLFIESLNIWKEYEWLKSHNIIIIFSSLFLMYFINKWLLFSESKTEKIISKYQNKYPSIENAPVSAFIIFHIFLPIILFVLFAYLIVKIDIGNC